MHKITKPNAREYGKNISISVQSLTIFSLSTLLQIILIFRSDGIASRKNFGHNSVSSDGIITYDLITYCKERMSINSFDCER